jgi:hypothetical protein
MSHRSKSGQKRKRHKRHLVLKRRAKRKRAALLAAGKIKKGVAPAPSQAAQS